MFYLARDAVLLKRSILRRFVEMNLVDLEDALEFAKSDGVPHICIDPLENISALVRLDGQPNSVKEVYKVFQRELRVFRVPSTHKQFLEVDI